MTASIQVGDVVVAALLKLVRGLSSNQLVYLILVDARRVRTEEGSKEIISLLHTPSVQIRRTEHLFHSTKDETKQRNVEVEKYFAKIAYLLSDVIVLVGDTIVVYKEYFLRRGFADRGTAKLSYKVQGDDFTVVINDESAEGQSLGAVLQPRGSSTTVPTSTACMGGHPPEYSRQVVQSRRNAHPPPQMLIHHLDAFHVRRPTYCTHHMLGDMTSKQRLMRRDISVDERGWFFLLLSIVAGHTSAFVRVYKNRTVRCMAHISILTKETMIKARDRRRAHRTSERVLRSGNVKRLSPPNLPPTYFCLSFWDTSFLADMHRYWFDDSTKERHWRVLFYG
ncbi:hypothetical protein H257_15903 [Aphanomyces astaci]|uniref:Uncharacterized protein n=1 Tax=Aphanomyces astaci TaxID=112090 RepID=W4FND4_APHAT|nr:hypothetical protein H257_15903 [Aphanomyces astaci]ETV68178.1 hypothetical protein H257_15903 [Aphanomyces astaci]|eukprot:XP_009842477.1 hypothetical protein H257_15903 [Aphanomyces astaci]